MITNFPLFVAFMLVILICAISLCTFVFYVESDPFMMANSLKDFKKKLASSECLISKVTEIKDKMINCPPIGAKTKPIVVYNDGMFFLLIVGDLQGKPRLFVFNKGTSYSIPDVYKLVETDTSFKRQGIKHSIDAVKLDSILKEASKIKFKSELEDKQKKLIYEHFKNKTK